MFSKAIEKKLSDLERLARAEKKYQWKSCPTELSVNHAQMELTEHNAAKNELKSRGL